MSWFGYKRPSEDPMVMVVAFSAGVPSATYQDGDYFGEIVDVALGETHIPVEVPDGVVPIPFVTSMSAGTHHSAWWDASTGRVRVNGWNWTAGFAAEDADFQLSVFLRKESE